MRRSLLNGVVLVIALCGVSARGQQTPVVMVHGFGSDGGTWSQLGILLTSTGFYQTYAPSLTWANSISSQASQLDAYMTTNVVPSSAYVVAHSMGGLTSRALTRIRAVNSVLTIGSPHAGASIARLDSLISIKSQNANTAAWLAHSALDDFILNGDFSDPLYDAAYNALDMLDTSDEIWFIACAAASGLQYHAQASLTDLLPNSSFLQDLNSTESSIVLNHKLSFESELPIGYYGGPLVVLEDPATADYDGFTLQISAAFAGMDAMNLLVGSTDSQLDAWSAVVAAGALENFASELSNFSDWWTYTIVGGYPHDGIIPTQSQRYPGGLPVTGLTFVHTSETTQGIPKIIAQLNAFTGR